MGSPTDRMASTFGHLAGSWRGTSGFRLMPTDAFAEAPASATVSAVAGGHHLLVTYSWSHPTDGPQDGVLAGPYDVMVAELSRAS